MQFDAIYLDAFSPDNNPECWTTEFFLTLFQSLKPFGKLSTYCAKGVVRRSLEAAGFEVTKLPGPPGKREIVVATRPWCTTLLLGIVWIRYVTVICDAKRIACVLFGNYCLRSLRVIPTIIRHELTQLWSFQAKNSSPTPWHGLSKFSNQESCTVSHVTNRGSCTDMKYVAHKTSIHAEI